MPTIANEKISFEVKFVQICDMGINLAIISTICRLHFVIVLTVWYFVFDIIFYFVKARRIDFNISSNMTSRIRYTNKGIFE